MDERRVPISAPGEFFIREHPLAPIFSLESRKNVQTTIEQLISEVSSGNFPSSEYFIELLRQAGFVSLWFFLKVIAGSEGPYNEINEDLHLEMCNFRQSDYCMAPGARAATFVPRGFLKSTIMTHGADTWELTRNPDLSICIVNAIIDKARAFKRNVQRTFDSNKLFGELYPEHVPASGAPRWNEDEMVLPSRTRYRTEPSLAILGATGASEGSHYDLFNPDDLNGLDDLDPEHAGNMNMYAKVQWFKTNQRALLRSQKNSRIVFCATRYSSDDTAQTCVDDAKQFFGFTLEEFEPKKNGTWTIYNRLGVENDVEVFPDVLTKATLEKQMEDDFWSAMTQSMNRPQKTGLAEFAELQTKKASLHWDEVQGRYFIVRGGDENFEELEAHVALGNCDVVGGLDPAGTDKDISAKTSRTAFTIWAMDPDGNYYLIYSKVGYFSTLRMFDEVYAGIKKFEGYIRTVVVESNAMQKILKPVLDREAYYRNTYASFKALPASGDKDARIRVGVGTPLQRGLVYICDGCGLEFKQEQKIFPQSKWRKDTLDSSEKAITELRKPFSKEEEGELQERDEEFASRVRSRITGY